MVELSAIETLGRSLEPFHGFHVLRHDSIYKQNLSYRDSFGSLSSFYLNSKTVENAVSFLEGLISLANNLSAAYVLKKTVDNSLEKKDTLENDKPGLLTSTEKESTMAKYVKSENVGEKASAAREYAMSLREEMTTEAYQTISNVLIANRPAQASTNQLASVLAVIAHAHEAPEE